MSWLVVQALVCWVFLIGKTHFLDSLQTVWLANSPLFKDLYASICIEKKRLKKHFILPLSTAKGAGPVCNPYQ